MVASKPANNVPHKARSDLWIEFKNVEATAMDAHTIDQFTFALKALKAQFRNPEELVMVFRNKLSANARAKLNEICRAEFNKSFPASNLVELLKDTPFYRLP